VLLEAMVAYNVMDTKLIPDFHAELEGSLVELRTYCQNDPVARRALQEPFNFKRFVPFYIASNLRCSGSFRYWSVVEVLIARHWIKLRYRGDPMDSPVGGEVHLGIFPFIELM
jgi:hypothetical protein